MPVERVVGIRSNGAAVDLYPTRVIGVPVGHRSSRATRHIGAADGCDQPDAVVIGAVAAELGDDELILYGLVPT